MPRKRDPFWPLGCMHDGMKVFLLTHHAELLNKIMEESMPNSERREEDVDYRKAWEASALHLGRLTRSLSRLQERVTAQVSPRRKRN